MRATRRVTSTADDISHALKEFFARRAVELVGLGLIALTGALALALMTWSVDDPSLTHAKAGRTANWLGTPGAITADLAMQIFGVAAIAWLVPPALWGWRLVTGRRLPRLGWRILLWIAGALGTAAVASALPAAGRWPLPTGLGGVAGDAILGASRFIFILFGAASTALAGLLNAGIAILALSAASGFGFIEDAATKEDDRKSSSESYDEAADEPGWGIVSVGAVVHAAMTMKAAIVRVLSRRGRFGTADSTDEDVETAPSGRERREPVFAEGPDLAASRVAAPPAAPKPGRRLAKEAQPTFLDSDDYELPALSFLTEPKKAPATQVSAEALEENAKLLESVLEDFGVRGEIINVRPGPVVTLYELEPAPGTKSSRVIALADDIARSMSAVSARVAVVPGRNAIGIELPNQRRETVYLRDLLATPGFRKREIPPDALPRQDHRRRARNRRPRPHAPPADRRHHRLGQVGGHQHHDPVDPLPADARAVPADHGRPEDAGALRLRRHPAPARAGRHRPQEGHRRAEMGGARDGGPLQEDVEDRRAQHRRLQRAHRRGLKRRARSSTRTVQTGFDRATGQAIYEEEVMDLEPLPYLVVIIDEVADLMMVAGKDIEGAIQRLAQMARAAGIHLIMATQRPSVDVITGTIKANFPTRISFQVTSKIDSRTILGEQGAEQLLGQGDMLYMAGGGRITRVHGPFVSDDEVEKVVAHLQGAGHPEYLEAVTAGDAEESQEGEDGGLVFDQGDGARRRRPLRRRRWPWSRATRRPPPPTSSAACRSATTAPPRSWSAWRTRASSAPPTTPASARSWSKAPPRGPTTTIEPI